MTAQDFHPLSSCPVGDVDAADASRTTFRKLKIAEMQCLTVGEYRAADKQPIVVVLDSVRSLYNVGSVFRTCDAFRVERIMLCGVTATPPNAEIHKTALGAELSVAWQHFDSALDAVQLLHDEGYEVVAIEQCEGSTYLDSFHPLPDHKYALVLGNEVHGVQQQVVDASDMCIEIPQFGTKHSLNVSVTAGIVIHHFQHLTQ